MIKTHRNAENASDTTVPDARAKAQNPINAAITSWKLVGGI